MNIPLDNGYRLSADKYQWIIQKYKPRKSKDTGELEEGWENLSFHGTINQAINHHAGVLVRTSEAETLAEALKVIESVVASLTRDLTPVFEVHIHREGKQ